MNVKGCQHGTDQVAFGFGHTVFAVEGLNGGYCEFYHGTEIENPRWDGTLDTYCKVPIDKSVKLDINDYGIDFSPIDEFCSKS